MTEESNLSKNLSATEIAERLRNKAEKEKKKLRMELVNALISEFQKNGATLYPDSASFVKHLKDEQYIVRRDHPQKFIEHYMKGEAFPVVFDPAVKKDDPAYANSVWWKPSWGSRGLTIAINEAQTNLEGLGVVFGILPNKNVTSYELSSNQKFSGDINNPGAVGNAHRDEVIGTEGVVAPDDLQFIMIRVPHSLMPDTFLTEEDEKVIELTNKQRRKRGEEESDNIPIYRYLVFPKAQI